MTVHSFSKQKWGVVLFLIAFLAAGCATSKQKKETGAGETDQDVQSALQAVAGSLSGKELSKEEVNKLSKDLETNKDSKSAVESVTNAVTGTGNVIYYCPVDGKRFSSRVKVCPEHHVELKLLE